ncbi:hypothetical protein Sjap_005098 [Stephania japonica]|uniref:Secreted protein n=1 Tax=Stephania japonica TaxID=461633 RepID=A0AAP0PKU0_9MAGN
MWEAVNSFPKRGVAVLWCFLEVVRVDMCPGLLVMVEETDASLEDALVAIVVARTGERADARGMRQSGSLCNRIPRCDGGLRESHGRRVGHGHEKQQRARESAGAVDRK